MNHEIASAEYKLKFDDVNSLCNKLFKYQKRVLDLSPRYNLDVDVNFVRIVEVCVVLGTLPGSGSLEQDGHYTGRGSFLRTGLVVLVSFY